MTAPSGGAARRGIVPLALGLGLAADRLLWMGPGGAGLTAWVTLLAVAGFVLAARAGVPWATAVAGWGGVAVMASVLMLWRASPAVHLLLWAALFTAASMVLLRAQGHRLGATLPTDHPLALLGVPFSAGLGAILVAIEVPRPDRAAGRHLLALGRGALLGAPLLLVFGGLFVEADAGFARRADAVLALGEDLPAHAVLFMAFAWIAAGLLRSILPHPEWIDVRRRPRLPQVGAVEVGVALGPLAALFLVFMALQLGYLFGGRATIEATTGLTLAEYARRGFFELMLVALLLVPVLTAGAAAARRGTARTLFRALGSLLVACVLVVLVSAAQRLHLYQAEFGLTMDRVLAATVMAWLAVVLALLAGTVLRGRPRRFGSGAVVAGLLTVFGLAAVDPAALVVRTNLGRADTEPADAAYLVSLGHDAVPALLDGLPALRGDRLCHVARGLLEDYPADGPPADWRLRSRARAVAEERVREARPRLERIAAACPEAAPGSEDLGSARRSTDGPSSRSVLPGP